jgi:hypothetical protein
MRRWATLDWVLEEIADIAGEDVSLGASTQVPI